MIRIPCKINECSSVFASTEELKNEGIFVMMASEGGGRRIVCSVLVRKILMIPPPVFERRYQRMHMCSGVGVPLAQEEVFPPNASASLSCIGTVEVDRRGIQTLSPVEGCTVG